MGGIFYVHAQFFVSGAAGAEIGAMDFVEYRISHIRGIG